MNWKKIPIEQQVNKNTQDISTLNSNLSNIGGTSSTITETPTRANVLGGAAYIAGKLLVIQFTFKATASATNSPRIASIPQTLTCDAALTAIDITNGIASAITSAVPCGISESGVIYIKETIIDHIYAVSGAVRCK